MREVSLKEYQQLFDLYTADSISQTRFLYYELLEIKNCLLFSTVKIHGVNPVIIDSENSFLNWIISTFPNMVKYFIENGIPKVFDQSEFQMGKSNLRASDITMDRLKIIRNVEIWGNKQKIKQLYKKVEEITFDKDLLTIYLSNNAFLQVFDSNMIEDNRYNLVIKDASKIILAYTGKEIISFSKVNNNLVEILSNNKLIQTIDVKSVYLKAINIFK